MRIMIRPDETVLEEARIRKILIYFALAAVAVGFFMRRQSGVFYIARYYIYQYLMYGGAALAALCLICGNAFQLVLTTERVIGVKFFRGFEIPFKDVVAVECSVPLGGRSLEFGTVIIRTKKRTYKFRRVVMPKHIVGLIRREASLT